MICKFEFKLLEIEWKWNLFRWIFGIVSVVLMILLILFLEILNCVGCFVICNVVLGNGFVKLICNKMCCVLFLFFKMVFSCCNLCIFLIWICWIFLFIVYFSFLFVLLGLLKIIWFVGLKVRFFVILFWDVILNFLIYWLIVFSIVCLLFVFIV